MRTELSNSVGEGGANHPDDVATVQALLNSALGTKNQVDRRFGPQTLAAIKTFQARVMARPDGRIDPNGKTWRELVSKARSSGVLLAAAPATRASFNEQLCATVDAEPVLRGAGIVVLDERGQAREIRGGPRRTWVYISSAPLPAHQTATPQRRLPTFWDRWGGSVLSCGSTAATGVVIYLSGGTATPLVGAFAVNSAALCGMSLGKAIEYDAWQEFELEGGGAYKTWLTIETAMSLADLANGVKGAIGMLNAWRNAGKLAQLQKAVAGKKLTRAQLAKVIQEVDPSFKPNLKTGGAGYFSKKKLILAGQEVLAQNGFASLGIERAKVLTDAVGNVMTLAGAPPTANASRATYELWFVQYGDE